MQLINLEHKIEEDSTEASETAKASLLKLTYNKMCPCTILFEEKKKEEKSENTTSSNMDGVRRLWIDRPEAANEPTTSSGQ